MHRERASVPALVAIDRTRDRPLIVHVIATTDAGTRSALLKARQLCNGLGAQIIVLVPHQVSYMVPLTHPTESPAIIVERYRRLVSTIRMDAHIQLCLCRCADDVFRELLAKPSLVVIGGPEPRWWRSSPAEHVARRLRKAGHEVVFASL